MTSGEAVTLLQNAMRVATVVAAPILLASMVMGLLIAILQAVTQIHEQTMAFVCKLVVLAIILLLLGPWMMSNLTDFADLIFQWMLK